MDTADAASHVEEDINTELASVTIRHQQTVVKGVEDRADEKGAVIHILVKVRLADMMRYKNDGKKNTKDAKYAHVFCFWLFALTGSDRMSVS